MINEKHPDEFPGKFMLAHLDDKLVAALHHPVPDYAMLFLGRDDATLVIEALEFMPTSNQRAWDLAAALRQLLPKLTDQPMEPPTK